MTVAIPLTILFQPEITLRKNLVFPFVRAWLNPYPFGSINIAMSIRISKSLYGLPASELSSFHGEVITMKSMLMILLVLGRAESFPGVYVRGLSRGHFDFLRLASSGLAVTDFRWLGGVTPGANCIFWADD